MRAQPKRFVEYAKSAGPDVLRTIRAALLDQPEDLQRFEELAR